MSPAARRVAAGSLLLCVAVLSACTTGGRTRREAPGDQTAPDAPTTPAATAPDRGDPQARFAEALDLMKKKQVKEAQDAFQKLTQDFPDFSGPQTNLGILLAKSNQRPAALAAFSKAAASNPQNAAAQNWLGILYRESGDYARSQQSYERALAIRPDYASAQLNLGLLFDEYLKRPNDALPHYREYQKLAGKEDLRVLVWIAEIEAKSKPAPAVEAKP